MQEFTQQRVARLATLIAGYVKPMAALPMNVVARARLGMSIVPLQASDADHLGLALQRACRELDSLPIRYRTREAICHAAFRQLMDSFRRSQLFPVEIATVSQQVEGGAIRLKTGYEAIHLQWAIDLGIGAHDAMRFLVLPKLEPAKSQKRYLLFVVLRMKLAMDGGLMTSGFNLIDLANHDCKIMFELDHSYINGKPAESPADSWEATTRKTTF